MILYWKDYEGYLEWLEENVPSSEQFFDGNETFTVLEETTIEDLPAYDVTDGKIGAAIPERFLFPTPLQKV